jgi:hypothetical protein
MKFELLQELSSLEEFRDNDIIDLSVKGWNHPKDWWDKFILPELTDYYSNSTFRLMKKEEVGYTCSRYFEEQDANDEGYACWLDFQKYRKGLGKVTIYTIQILDAEEVKP